MTDARPRPYGAHYGPGDVIGVYIKLSSDPSLSKALARKRDRVEIAYKGACYYEEKEGPVLSSSAACPRCPHSEIRFYKNGACQGVAFENIPYGSYYPALSVYKTSSVTANFGPSFKYPPSDSVSYRPFVDRYFEASVESTVSDLVDAVEAALDPKTAAFDPSARLILPSQRNEKLQAEDA